MTAIDQLARQARRVAAGQCPDVPSPCVSICRMDPLTELCEGCFRTLDEIALWSRMADEGKKQVWAAIAQRMQDRQAA